MKPGDGPAVVPAAPLQAPVRAERRDFAFSNGCHGLRRSCNLQSVSSTAAQDDVYAPAAPETRSGNTHQALGRRNNDSRLQLHMVPEGASRGSGRTGHRRQGACMKGQCSSRLDQACCPSRSVVLWTAMPTFSLRYPGLLPSAISKTS